MISAANRMVKYMDNDPRLHGQSEFPNTGIFYPDSSLGFSGHHSGVSLIAQHPYQGTFEYCGSVDLLRPLNDFGEPSNLGISLASPRHENGLQFQQDNIYMPLYEGNDSNLGLYLGPRAGPSHLHGDMTEVPDVPDTCFDYISDLLREEDPSDKPGTLNNYLAFRSYYQSLDDVLHQPSPFPSYQEIPVSVCPTSRSLEDNMNPCSSSRGSNGYVTSDSLNELSTDNLFRTSVPSNLMTARRNDGGKLGDSVLDRNRDSIFSVLEGRPAIEGKGKETDRGEVESCPNNLYGKELRIHCRDEGNATDQDEARSSKQPAASTTNTYEQIVQYEDDLFCPEDRDKVASKDNEKARNANSGSSSQGSNRKAKKKAQASAENVDHYDLLTRCAQAISNMEIPVAQDLLKKLSLHSSPYGNSAERVAHYFANALESRLLGTGTAPGPPSEPVSVSDILKANRMYVAAVPFMIMSYYVSNKTIATLAQKVSRLHVIDFGISLGLQWPCIINNLSKRPGGPPKLRITGIDFPQPGLRPAERVLETGRCLARYCARFNVPFEYHPIVNNWENIKPGDIYIDRDELVVINCMYRSQHLLDMSMDLNSPRDGFLSLVKQIRPHYFIHGIVNAAFGKPIFMTRFKDALSHYSTLFDVFEATMPRGDHERLLLESKVCGKELMNVVACEGAERVERPETYKRWQLLQRRVGFEQVPLDQELLKSARAMVRRNFSELFVLDEDSQWAVQGWRGRILYAISCWKVA
ncbi:hypothetical protein Droror1_Dr00003276 [Drosera rotundifolia]